MTTTVARLTVLDTLGMLLKRGPASGGALVYVRGLRGAGRIDWINSGPPRPPRWGGAVKQEVYVRAYFALIRLVGRLNKKNCILPTVQEARDSAQRESTRRLEAAGWPHLDPDSFAGGLFDAVRKDQEKVDALILGALDALGCPVEWVERTYQIHSQELSEREVRGTTTLGFMLATVVNQVGGERYHGEVPQALSDFQSGIRERSDWARQALRGLNGSERGRDRVVEKYLRAAGLLT